MKVLLVTTVFGQGPVGPATFANYLATSEDIDCDILTENVSEREGIYSVNINQNRLQRKLSIYYRIKPFQHKLKSIASNYDIILFNNAILARGISGLNVPYLVMINDDNLIHHSFSMTKQGLVNSLYKRIEKKSAKRAKSVIVNSKFLGQKVTETYQIERSKISVLYKGVDTNLFRPSTFDFNQPVKILFVKNDFRRGGLFDLLSALQILKEYNFELTIIGAKPDLSKTDKGANTTISMSGTVPHNKLPKLLYGHHIYCVPSQREALGVSNMEAMASGIPVITTDAGGIPEVISPKEGWIANVHDPKSLANQIKSCIENPKLREQKRQLALDKVKAFSKDVMIEKLSNILKKEIDS